MGVLNEQVVVNQILQQPSGGEVVVVDEGRGDVGIQVRARHQAKVAEQVLRGGGEVGVGQVEHNAQVALSVGERGDPLVLITEQVSQVLQWAVSSGQCNTVFDHMR